MNNSSSRSNKWWMKDKKNAWNYFFKIMAGLGMIMVVSFKTKVPFVTQVAFTCLGAIVILLNIYRWRQYKKEDN